MILGFLFSLFFAQPPPESQPALPGLEPVSGLRAKDAPNDAGKSIDLTWEPSPDPARIACYEVLRAPGPQGPFDTIVKFFVPTTAYTDADTLLVNNKPYYYRVDVVDKFGARASSEIVGPVEAKAQWFSTGRIPVLVVAILYGALVLIYIELAKRDQKMFIRRIAGLDAIDEAVGRSTEMGKPILFTFGIGYLTDLATLAALSILRRIAKRAAEYETRLIIPNYDPVVMAAAQETVKQGLSEAGRPDLYNEGDITFLTSDQFGYAAGVDGIISREQPGTIFLQGIFFAESLILAETGHSVGAIQIAGTVMPEQLPFFVAACDYTLLGEELYAASAYIDRDPQLMGSLKSEDMAKIVTVIVIALVSLLGTAGFVLAAIAGPETNFLKQVFDAAANLFSTT